MLAGTAGVGLLAAGLIASRGVDSALAQDDATPDATDDATPEAGIGGTESETETTDDDATTAIDGADRRDRRSAQADRDAVADQIDTTTVDALLGQAVDLRDRAQTAADGGDAGEARRLARAAGSTAKAAGDLVGAQLIGAALPSQEAPASRILATAFESIQAAGEAAADSTDADVAFSLSTAQALYQSAFDLYGAGAYGQAAATAAVGARLAKIAAFLANPDDGAGFGDGRGAGRRAARRTGRRTGPRRGAGDEPVEVPAPSF